MQSLCSHRQLAAHEHAVNTLSSVGRRAPARPPAVFARTRTAAAATRTPVVAAAAAPGGAAQQQQEPHITIKFVTPDPQQEAVAVSCPSGEQLRACMLDNKVDLYTAWGKLWSCGGAGQCGTCIVQVQAGGELLSGRTATEDKKLNKKPSTWRLACQTIVGDGSNSGEVVIATKPQSK